MASPRVKATYSLDTETLRVLERAAERWGVSKSEALRRAIRATASLDLPGATPTGALDQLQAAARMSGARASTWAAEVRAERRASRPRAKSK